MPGTLYLVATPIGNLEDITHRALRVLGEVDVIACEDTRQTGKLLAHFHIHRPLLSYHEHNELERAGELLKRLCSGADVALVSDAGTPIVADPGYRIVELATKEGIPVVPVPGASAVLAALTASGLPSDSFVFLGFVPQKAARRREMSRRIRDLETTVVLYEAPHRILATLDDLRAELGDRPIVAAREMTKLHEEFLRGTAASVRQALAARSRIKGEFTIVIGKPKAKDSEVPDDTTIRDRVAALVSEGVPRMEAIKSVARQLKRPKREVYRAVEEDRP